MGLFISITSIYFFPSIVLGIILAIKIKSFMEVLLGFLYAFLSLIPVVGLYLAFKFIYRYYSKSVPLKTET